MVEAKQDLGLSVLTSSAVFGAWSAWNSSLFTAATFVDSETKYRNAKIAMDLGLATAVATGLGVYLVYGDRGKIAAVSAIGTGIILYLAYYYKLQANPVVAAFMKKNNRVKTLQLQSNEKDNKEWTPLSENAIQQLRDIINNQYSIETVKEP